jgi:hypothetical protein
VSPAAASRRLAAPPLSILDALADRALFGGLPAFRDLSTWRAWLVFLKATYGLELTDAEVEVFRHHTGRVGYDPPAGGFPEVVCIVGRQSGKTRSAATIAAFEAVLAEREPDRTELYAVLVAQDHRAALRTLFGYARAPFENVPVLTRSISEIRSDTIRLRSGVTLAAYPCRPAAMRGLRARVAVVDKLAFFTATDGRPTDVEMLRALRPALATTGGKLIVLSSPYGQFGALWELHRRHFGRDDSAVLVWQATAPDMNPSLPRDYLERMREDDPEAYRSEVLGEFRSSVATFFDPDALDACVVPDRHELPPAEGVSYQAFVDPSGGSRDAFSLAIAHAEGDRVVVDLVRAWVPPFNPSGVVEEIASVLRTYDVSEVVGDRYTGEWPREQFRRCNVEYRVAELDRSRLYLELLPRVNAGTVEFPHDPALLRELRGLERRRGPSGRDRVDHRPGEHDDRANAVAGVVQLVGCAPADWRDTFFAC